MSERIINNRDPYLYVVDKVLYGVYDTGDSLICKVKDKKEALRTVSEFRRIDKELYGKKGQYFIRKL